MSQTATAILPVAYLPPISHFAAMVKHQSILWDVFEHYHKQFYYNRCVIYGPNGAQKLTMPIHKRFEKTALKDIEIANEIPWKNIHWKSFEAAYRRSPYFEYYESDLYPIYFEFETTSLVEWNMKLLETICRLMEIEINVSLTTEYHKEYTEISDYRNLANPQDTASFEEKTYRQVFQERYGFIPNLSIIDLLFCEGPHAKELLLS